ncbi:MAG: TetR/AcrR family transcriptional regulator [Lachnospiraceae bacterium]
MTTKERIIEEALTLFSIKGYKGTSVKNIADAVGIKDSSLYKHFHSKREIFDTIVLEMRKRMEHLSERVGLPEESDFSKAAEAYGALTLEGLQELSKNIFSFYLTDDFVSRFWRVANMEQYQNPELYQIFRQIFMEESIEYQTELFRMMIEKQIFIEGNPRVMAMNFYAPIFFLLSKYSGREELEEEAQQQLQEQIAEFYRVYRKV